MNRLDKIGVGGEGVNGVFSILPDEAFHVMDQFCDLPGQQPASLIFHLSPQAFERVEFRTIRGHKQTYHIVWEDERCGCMAAPIIHEHDVQRVLIALGKFVDKDLKIGCIQLGELQEKAFSGRGLDSPLHVEVLATVLPRSDRFHAAQRHASTVDRQQAKPTFSLATDSHRTLKRW